MLPWVVRFLGSASGGQMPCQANHASAASHHPHNPPTPHQLVPLLDGRGAIQAHVGVAAVAAQLQDSKRAARVISWGARNCATRSGKESSGVHGEMRGHVPATPGRASACSWIPRRCGRWCRCAAAPACRPAPQTCQTAAPSLRGGGRCGHGVGHTEPGQHCGLAPLLRSMLRSKGRSRRQRSLPRTIPPLPCPTLLQEPIAPARAHPAMPIFSRAPGLMPPLPERPPYVSRLK